MDITKRSAKEGLGFTRDVQLAQFFNTTKQAVSRWDEDQPLPPGRQWELRAKRPDVFGDAPSQDGEEVERAA